jgi:hypothetical protein
MQMQQDAYQAEMAKLDGFWQQQTDAIADIDPQTADFKAMELPLARVKKIMRLEDDLKVRAHALLCKSCAALHFKKKMQLLFYYHYQLSLTSQSSLCASRQTKRELSGS